MRTGLAALASAVGTKALLTGVAAAWIIRAAGTVMIVFSLFCFVAAIWRELRPGLPSPQPATGRIPAFILVAFGLLMAALSLSVLIGLYLTP